MTKKTNHTFLFSDHSSRRSCLAAVVTGLLLTSCFFYGRDVINESLKDSVTLACILKDKRPVEIKYEKLERYFTPYSWLSGISQPSTQVYCYIVVTATIKRTFGWDKVYRWIDAYPDHAVYFTKLDSMVFTGDNAFVKYTYIPAFPADDYWHYSYINNYYNSRNRNPFGGNPRLLVKYGRYKGTSSLQEDKDDSYRKIHLDTYKWPKKYVWNEVSKEDFDRAAQAGDVMSFDTISSNGNFDFYFMQTRPEESMYYYGKRREKGNDPFFSKGLRKEVDYYDYYSRRLVSDHELDLFLSSVKTRDAKKVEDLLNSNPALITSYDPDGMTALHLALLSSDRHPLLPVLYTFNPQINAIDYKSRTPLKIALIAHCCFPN